MIEQTSVILDSRPVGPPTSENFRIMKNSLSEINDGHVLLKTIYLSLDPYMRGRMNADKSYADPVPIGGIMEGECVAEIINSKNSNSQEWSHPNILKLLKKDLLVLDWVLTQFLLENLLPLLV